MIRKIVKCVQRGSLTAFLLLTIASCSTGEPRGEAMGYDYFAVDRSCRRGMLEQEGDAKKLVLYQTYRKTIMSDQGKGVVNPRLIVTGDSIAALFHRGLLKKHFPNMRSVNRGIPGDTTFLFATRLDEDVIALAPRYILISIGGNDILAGRCLDEVLNNTITISNSILEQLKDTHIFFISVPPVLTWKANSITPYYNHNLERFARTNSRLHFLDIWPVMAREDLPVLREDFQRRSPDGRVDRIHFNDEGYRIISELFKQQLGTMK